MRHKKIKEVKEVKKEKKLLSYASPRWSGEILDCSMPMTFDQYDHCSYNCLYCFSFYQKALKAFNPLFPNQVGKHYQQTEPRAVSLNRFKKMFNLERKCQFTEYIKQKITMQWGGLSDPFDMFERKYGRGLEILKFLKEKDYPLCFSTKGTWWIYDDRYVELFHRQRNWNVKFSIINLDKKKASLMEMGVPSPEVRLQAIKDFNKIRGNGGSTLRLRPFIIGLSNPDHEELIEQAADAGVQAVSMEFFCYESRAVESMIERYDRMSEIVGFDIREFYRSNTTNLAGYYRLNWKIKEKYVNECEKICKKRRLRFYVSDSDHKDRCANGSCCGLPESWNYSRGQFTEALLIAKKKGIVRFSDISSHLEMYKGFEWRVAEGLNTQGTMTRCRRWGQTMFDYFREVWNTPNFVKSPYKIFNGLLHPVKVDKKGDVVYEYRPYR